MSIVTTIEDIVGALPIVAGGSTFPNFRHGDKFYQNLEVDEIQGVTIFLDEPILSEDVLTQGGYIEEEYPLFMFFGRPIDKLDPSPLEWRAVIDEMRTLSKRFILRAQANPDIRFVKKSKRIDTFRLFNANLTGVILQITIVPKNSEGACVN